MQKLEPENRAAHDPFLDRCFGYSITMDGAEKISDLEMKAVAVRKINLKIATLTDICKGEECW